LLEYFKFDFTYVVCPQLLPEGEEVLLVGAEEAMSSREEDSLYF